MIDTIMSLYRERGHMEYGEDVTERMHALQCGLLAEAEGQPDTVVAAAFLHDIGHLLHDMGEDVAERGIDAKHEDEGDRWLRASFPEIVTEPVRLHVAAKRYLCTVEPGYLEGLSEASVKSYHLQGGPMSPDEVAEFERHPNFEQVVLVRRYDDRGKDPDMPEIDVEHFRPILERVLLSNNEQAGERTQ